MSASPMTPPTYHPEKGVATITKTAKDTGGKFRNGLTTILGRTIVVRPAT